MKKTHPESTTAWRAGWAVISLLIAYVVVADDPDRKAVAVEIDMIQVLHAIDRAASPVVPVPLLMPSESARVWKS